jgi:hypothetical protein
LQAARGCREPVGFPVFTLDNQDYYKCPRALVTPLTGQLLRLYGHYTRGFLPVAGGVIDQAPAFLRAMEIIGSIR